MNESTDSFLLRDRGTDSHTLLAYVSFFVIIYAKYVHV